MKSTNYIKVIFILILSFATISCNKDLDEGEDFAPLEPTQLDEDAMDWLSVSTDATDVTLAKIKTAAETSTPKIFDPANDIAAVTNVNSDAYKAELATIKDLQSKLTSDQKKIIEYKLRNEANERLIGMNLRAFADETASESPAPGGGSISAYVGSLGAALGTMVANLSAGKRGWENQITFFSNQAAIGQELKAKLLLLVDEDTNAFNKIMLAFGLPKGNDDEKKARTLAIEEATKYACEVPYLVMETAFATLDLLDAMVKQGNPNSITDAGVGVLCIKTTVQGAYYNVMVNAQGLKDRDFAENIKQKAKHILERTTERATEILQVVEKAIE